MEVSGDDFLDVSKLDFEGSVEEQIDMLLAHVRLSRGDVIGLRNLLCDLEDALRTIWPGCEVQPFGSIVSGLGIKSSDVDVFVQIYHQPRDNRADPVILARNVIRKIPWKFARPFAITSAKVPILKFFHTPTGCECDVNFKSPTGVRNSKLLFHLLKTDPKALKLAIIVKYWSKVFKFSGTNLLPNYALSMLVIFYLQGVNILTSVENMQRGLRPIMIEGWNTAFDSEATHPNLFYDSLYHLLGGFFQYYSLFRFDQFIVCPFLGVPVLRKEFEDVASLRNEFTLYKSRVMNYECKQLRIDSLMCIQDPFEHNRNCSVCVSAKLFGKIGQHFLYAARMYADMEPHHFLKAVLSQDPVVMHIERPVIRTNHKHNVLHNTINNKQLSKKQRNKMNKKLRNYAEIQKTNNTLTRSK